MDKLKSLWYRLSGSGKTEEEVNRNIETVEQNRRITRRESEFEVVVKTNSNTQEKIVCNSINKEGDYIYFKKYSGPRLSKHQVHPKSTVSVSVDYDETHRDMIHISNLQSTVLESIHLTDYRLSEVTIDIECEVSSYDEWSIHNVLSINDIKTEKTKLEGRTNKVASRGLETILIKEYFN